MWHVFKRSTFLDCKYVEEKLQSVLYVVCMTSITTTLLFVLQVESPELITRAAVVVIVLFDVTKRVRQHGVMFAGGGTWL